MLLGPSGCGKSPTMRLVAGLEEPSGGEIRIGARRIREAAKVEMEAPLERRPAERSGGQRQRVALARAIVRTPSLFLMDEPLSNLDAKLRTVMRAELKHLLAELGTTTIYVTHDQVEAMTLADRIVILDDARIQQVGTPASIYAHPANTFVAGFIGSPPMNLLEGRIEGGRFIHAGGAFAAPGRQGPVRLGIRPEDIRLAEDDAADLEGRVYSSELLGDATLLNVRVGGALVAVKAGPEDGRPMDAPVRLTLDRSRIHLFDPRDGTRLEGAP